MTISAMSALVGYIVYDVVKNRKKQKTEDTNPQIEISDLTAARVNTGETSGHQYQEYLPQRGKKNAVSLAGNDSHYQSLDPQKRSKQSGGFGIESSYQVVGGPGKSSLSHTEEAIYENA
ncbi:uncharacterized protein LOC110236550 [Exaiptasia diaphana]|uniref:Uncharacterized protein n=1 Tax=Exaiptasia diaphana TaxID=2652724 RepID=A0A913X2V5_EXADI|nr:uncharacterized protein LOC110236550 [Exaiptasia diaphana]